MPTLWIDPNKVAAKPVSDPLPAANVTSNSHEKYAAQMPCRQGVNQGLYHNSAFRSGSLFKIHLFGPVGEIQMQDINEVAGRTYAAAKTEILMVVKVFGYRIFWGENLKSTLCEVH